MWWDFITPADGPSPVQRTLHLSFTLTGSVLTPVPQVNLPAPESVCVYACKCVSVYV